MADRKDITPPLKTFGENKRKSSDKPFCNQKPGPFFKGSSRLTGIVLTAGLSSRMGSPKALLPLGGQPSLVRILREILTSELDQVILVLGAHGTFIRQALGELKKNNRLTLVYNPAYRQGLSTSIKKGLIRVSPHTGGVMFLMGDQPLLRASAINRLIRTFLEDSDRIVVPGYGRSPGNPVIFPLAMVPELLELSGDTGGREVMRRHQDRVRLLPIRPSRIGWDMDTPEDYQKIKEYFDEKG
jgi:molybdenum cofactor cytidylyltransferase